MTARGFTLRLRLHRRRPGARPRQRGIALIAVIVAIGICAVVGYDFAGSTNLDMTAAANQRDAARAQMLARSALNLSELVIRMQQKLDGGRNEYPIQITDYADQLMMAFCGTREEVEAALGAPVDQLKGLGADVGTCGVELIETEDGKLNLNCAASTAHQKTLLTRLRSLVFFPAFDPIFQEETADGWRRDRETQVTAIMDYIDKDRGKTEAPGTPEDYGYESLRDDYKAKDNTLDSIAEAKLIRGVDDRFWNVFGPAFTVYGGCRTNLAAVKDVNLVASILQLSAEDQNDPVIQDPTRLWMLAGVVVKAREFGFLFTGSDDFISFVEDPRKALTGASEEAAAAGMPSPTGGVDPLAACCGVPPGLALGLKLKKSALDQIVSFDAFRTYRVRAYGEVTRAQPIFPPVRRTFTGVWDTGTTNQNTRNNTMRKGAWVFMKEE